MKNRTKEKLIEDGCKLDQEIKALTAELDIIKIKIKKEFPEKGNFASSKTQDIISITSRKAYGDVDSKKVYNWFKKNSSMKEFLNHIKVQASASKVIPAKTWNKLRPEKDPTISISFKKVLTVAEIDKTEKLEEEKQEVIRKLKI